MKTITPFGDLEQVHTFNDIKQGLLVPISTFQYLIETHHFFVSGVRIITVSYCSLD